MNSNSSVNRGIQVQGDLNAGSVAFGRHSQAISFQGAPASIEPASLPELRAEIERLLEEVQAHRDEIAAPDEVIDAVRGAAEEVGSEKPRRGVVLALLTSVSTRVAGVLDLAGVTARLIKAVEWLIR